MLAAKNGINTSFIVINADDYYGKEGFKAVHECLVNGGKSCMAGFVLKNTLSDNGGAYSWYLQDGRAEQPDRSCGDQEHCKDCEWSRGRWRSG